VYTDTGTFTGRVKTGDARFGPLIGSDATHHIVRPGTDRNGSLNGIETGKLNGKFSDLGEPLKDTLAAKVSQVQQDAPVDPATLEYFLPDGQ